MIEAFIFVIGIILITPGCILVWHLSGKIPIEFYISYWRYVLVKVVCWILTTAIVCFGVYSVYVLYCLDRQGVDVVNLFKAVLFRG
jgi:hypothetical protein